MLKTRRQRNRSGKSLAPAVVVTVLLLGIAAALWLPVVRQSASAWFERFRAAPSDTQRSAAGSALTMRPGKPGSIVVVQPFAAREFLPKLGIWVLYVLIAALLLKLTYQWSAEFNDASETDAQRRVLTYQFRSRLPRRVTLGWRYKNRGSYLSPEIDWDGERVHLDAGAEFKTWAKGNVIHTVSLILADAATLETSHAIELVISQRLWLLRSGETILELEFDTRTVSAKSPPAESRDPVSVIKGAAIGAQALSDDSLETVGTDWDLRRVSSGDLETVLISIANEFIVDGAADHVKLRRRVVESGLDIGFYSPFRVQDSANCVFTRHWFRPDQQAGAWLWFEDGGQFMAVPFDRSQLKAETMRHFLASMYEGVGARFGQQTGVRIESTCKLVRARDEDEYRVVTPGRFSATDQLSAARKGITPASWGEKSESSARSSIRPDEEPGVRDIELLARIEALEARFVRFEARSHLAASQPMPVPAREPSRAEKEAVDNVRELVARIEIVEARFVRFEEKLAASAGFDDRLTRLEEDVVAAKQRNLGKSPALPRPPADPPQPTIPEARREVIASAATERLETEAMSVREESMADAPRTPSSGFTTAPRLPAWWKPTLVRARANSSAKDYLTTLQQTLLRLCDVAGDLGEWILVVHLVETDAPGVYDVHLRDEIVLDGTLIGRCVEKPGSRVPPWQFFIAWREASNESLWVVCPPTSYPAIGFGYSSLIQGTPSGEFSIESVRTPARLELAPDNHYKVSAQMEVTFA